MTTTVQVEAKEALRWIREAPTKVGRRALKAGVRAATKVYFETAKRLAPRGKTGLFRRSLMQKVGTRRRDGVAGVVGQRRRRYAQRKRGSQINRKGYAAPIHFIDRATKPHRIKPQGIATSTGQGKALKIGRKIRAAANHPGTKEQRVLARAQSQGQSQALQAFVTAVKTELAR